MIFLVFLGGSLRDLLLGQLGPLAVFRTLCRQEGIIPVQQRTEPFEQGGQLFIVQQTRRDDELTGPVRNQGGVGFQQSLDLRRSRVRAAISSGLLRLSGGAFRSHVNLLGSR